MEITFDNPYLLLFLLALPLMAAAHYYDWKHKKKESLTFSNFEAAARVFEPFIIPSYPLQLVLRILILLCLVFSAAGMNLWYRGPSTELDFALAIDASSSMSAEDLSPSRIGVAKEFASSFIDALPINSKVAVISFSGTSFIDQTLTDDHEKAIIAVNNIELKPIGGTDLGSAIITAANVLTTGGNQSKLIILLTDGQSTVGTPVQDAITYAQNLFITIDTIGIGTTEGGGYFGEKDVTTQLDKTTLEQISTSTGGKYYEIKTAEELRNLYKEISREVYKNVKITLTPYFISLVLLLLIMHWLLSFTRFSSLP